MITRREFLKVAGLLGLSVPLLGCGDGDGDDDGDGGVPGGADRRRVAVVGAGVAGLGAAHLLAGAGSEVTVFEASSGYGGRVRRDDRFVDFPISLGGEWLEAPASELPAILGDPEGGIDVELVPYDPGVPTAYFDGELTMSELGEFDSLNFVTASWFDVFDRYVVPGVIDAIRFDTEIVEIDHGADGRDAPVLLTTANGDLHEADHVIVTVPLRVLRERRLRFVPDLPDRKRRAIEAAEVWGGLKAFFEFDEAFYPSWTEFPDSDTATGQRYYYDAAYGRDTDAAVLGLFAVGTGAETYQALQGDDLRDHVLAELDEVFDGGASRSYRRHIVQDWSAEP
ncbi:MAG: FAD-dependent oxidoreductase, partial [Actinomycetota bacterium]